MSGGPRLRVSIAALLAALAVVGAPAHADRLHLAGGGTVDVVRWSIDGETLLYETASGTISVPRSVVVRIERTGAPRPADGDGELAAPGTPAESPGPSGTDTPERSSAGTIRVTREVAELMRRGRTALGDRDYRLAADVFGEALREGPDELQPARVGYAMAHLALGEDALAVGAVLDGLAREPRHPELLELLGDLRDREERVEDALGAWREARTARGDTPVERLERKIERAERELAAARDYAMSASSHFTLRHDGEVDRALTRAVLDHLEREFWRVTRELDHTPRQPITVQLFPERAFREVTGAESWVGGLYDGKIRVPLGGLRRLSEPARRVLTHELAHAVLHAKTRGNCPRWLHEGLAQRAERRRPAAAELRTVASLARGDDPALLLTDERFTYASSLSLTTFAIEHWGENALLRLLERLADGAALDEALADVYGETSESFARRWATNVVAAEER